MQALLHEVQLLQVLIRHERTGLGLGKSINRWDAKVEIREIRVMNSSGLQEASNSEQHELENNNPELRL